MTNIVHKGQGENNTIDGSSESVLERHGSKQCSSLQQFLTKQSPPR